MVIQYCVYFSLIQFPIRAHGDAAVEVLRYKPEDRGSIPDGVIEIFH
jgi:hypothetical protein